MIEFNVLETLLAALVVYLIGDLLNKKIKIFHHYCIPSPVIGGLLCSVFLTILNSAGILTVELDTALMPTFMIIFFTTIGLGASFKLVKLGGKLLVIYWLACGFLAIMQNIIGVSMATALGLDPLIGVMVGATSMEGGHGAATAFGQTIEEIGIEHALTIGLAAATLGLVAGGLVGGPVVKKLITKHNLRSTEEGVNDALAKDKIDSVQSINDKHINAHDALIMLLIVIFCSIVGGWIGHQFSEITGFGLPSYVSCMFLAVIVRNLLDAIDPKIIHMKTISLFGDLSLAVFLSMALMSINLMQISDLAIPMVLIIFCQVAFVILFGFFILFRLLGKNYDAAVMVAGFCGHGLGATPNAIANMDAVTKQYGHSYKAFLIVPIVGAFLIDIIALPVIITTINFFSNTL